VKLVSILPDGPYPGKPPPPPADNKPRRGDLLLADVQAVLQRFEDAQRKRRLAGLTATDDAAYAWELHEAAGEEREAAFWLADLLLLLLRYAGRHRPEALARGLARAVWPELVGELEDLVRGLLARELPEALRQLGR
jgi:hypothetical protein